MSSFFAAPSQNSDWVEAVIRTLRPNKPLREPNGQGDLIGQGRSRLTLRSLSKLNSRATAK